MNKYNIYPIPDYCAENGTTFILPKKAEAKCFGISQEAKTLYKELWKKFSLGLSEIIFVDDPSLKNEIVIGSASEIKYDKKNDFSMIIDNSSVVLKGVNTKALARAFTVLLQLMRPVGELRAEKIQIFGGEYSAFPKVEFRGVHLCIFPSTKLEFLQQFIRLMGMCRYSHLVLEFWGTYKFECFSKLGWEKDSYSKEQILPLIKEANAFGIEVVPFFNHLGHASQSRVVSGEHVVLSKNPEYAPLFEPDGWTWCISNPEALKILKNVRKELIELCGDGGYFHLGMDEAYSFCSCPRCKGKDRNKLLAKYLNELSLEMKEYGRRCIIWGDQLIDAKRFPRPFNANYVPDLETSKSISLVSREVIIADWQYRINESIIATSAFFKEQGFDVLQSPWYNSSNIKAHIETAIKLGHGVLMTTWNFLEPFIGELLHGAEMMWTGENKSSNYEYQSISGSILRKISDTGSNSGWLGLGSNRE